MRKEPGTDRIDYHHFLHGYNPLIPPHQLEGLATLRKFASTTALHSNNSTADFGQQSTNNLDDSSNFPKNSLSRSLPFKLSALNSSKSMTTLGKTSDDINVGKSTTSHLSGETAELRRIWQGVLRECHRADPERTGHVNRQVFIAALERANLPNVSDC